MDQKSNDSKMYKDCIEHLEYAFFSLEAKRIEYDNYLEKYLEDFEEVDDDYGDAEEKESCLDNTVSFIRDAIQNLEELDLI